MHKILMLAVACAFLVFGGACVTAALYDQPLEQNRAFVEEVGSFLITPDGSQLIVVGKQHHYIFAANDTLKFILGWPEKNRVQASFNNFVINSDQHVSGEYRLTVDALHLSADAQALLIAKGFKSSQAGLTYQGVVQGTRYLANKFTLPATLAFHQKYTINMRENYVSTSATLERILLTPLAVAADGALIIGGIPLLLLAIPIMAAQ